MLAYTLIHMHTHNTLTHSSNAHFPQNTHIHAYSYAHLRTHAYTHIYAYSYTHTMPELLIFIYKAYIHSH